MHTQLPLGNLLEPADGDRRSARTNRIFCNRSTRMDQITAIGFDMDYTLAVYQQDHMDRLSIEATAQKLVLRGYSERLLQMPYRLDFPIRGLLIDRKLGNVLKMDRYKYVKAGYHGLRKLTDEERRLHYHSKRLKPATARYHFVDTLYALSEVSVFAAAVDELEREGPVDYDRLFSDVRECIDLSHQDGSILDQVMADLSKFVVRDAELGPTLHRLRSAGKRVFLLTNSRAEYTDKMMTYLLGDQPREYPSWRNYFDAIVTAARKPTFFTESNPLLELLPDGTTKPAEAIERGHVYAGGNITDFERMLGVGGDHVLYVGDHIYGDVLRAKKETAWRTAMIIQEMTAELNAIESAHADVERLGALGQLSDYVAEQLRDAQRALKEIQKEIDSHRDGPAPSELEATRLRQRRAVDRLRARLREVEGEIDRLESHIDQAFHPFWGSLFKAGPETSSFGHQVEVYACLYTDRVTNFLAYSPTHYFRSPTDLMPHEL